MVFRVAHVKRLGDTDCRFGEGVIHLTQNRFNLEIKRRNLV